MNVAIPQHELRHDALTGRDVIIAAGRRHRPIRTPPVAAAINASWKYDDPFREGNEHNTPDERLALRGVRSHPNGSGWLLRVVANRYPAVDESASGDLSRFTGVHDVVVECPDGRTQLTDLSTVEVARVFAAWQMRIRQLRRCGNFPCVSVFRNEGNGAGASLPHCHSQILATELPGRQIRDRLDRSGEVDAWFEFEQRSAERIVRTSESLTTLCPFASRVDWATRIVPCDFRLTFESLSETTLIELAQETLSVLLGLKKIVGAFDHNIVLILPPGDHQGVFPWMLELLPRRSRFAGFELLTDTDIVTIPPESAAAQLREVYTVAQSPPATRLIQPAGYHWVQQR